MILLPFLLGSLTHTLAPNLLALGSYTTALFSAESAGTLVALQLFCIGTQVRVSRLSRVLRRGGVLLLARAASGLLAALLFRCCAREGTLFGISVLAAVAAISNTNGSIYLATASLLKQEEYAAGAPVLALTNGPFLIALILGASGSAHFSFLSIVALVLPMLLGMLVGNLSAKAAQFFAPGVTLLLPFIGFALGAGLDLGQLLRSGFSGLLLAVVSLLLGAGITLGFDRALNRGSGEMGIAASATGANAIAVPAAIALSNPAWRGMAQEATAQIGVAVILGAIFVPVLAQWWSRRVAKSVEPQPCEPAQKG